MTKSKELRQYAKDVLPNYKNEKHKIVIKPIKIGTRHGIMYCFGCKDFTHNFRPQEIKMTKKKKKKILREKSNCVSCWSNKSRFLKQKHNNEK